MAFAEPDPIRYPISDVDTVKSVVKYLNNIFIWIYLKTVASKSHTDPIARKPSEPKIVYQSVHILEKKNASP